MLISLQVVRDEPQRFRHHEEGDGNGDSEAEVEPRHTRVGADVLYDGRPQVA